VDWNKQNTKATEFIEKFFKSHDIWEKINLNMEWKQQDETTTKEERKVKKKIGQAQQWFKHYHDKK
jgi:hypothetical protein